KVPTPRELEASDPMAGQVIPLVRIVRSPMLTLGAKNDSPRDATPIKPTGIVNLQAHNAASARPKHGPGEQPAVREPKPANAVANKPIAGMPVKTAGPSDRARTGTVGSDR